MSYFGLYIKQLRGNESIRKTAERIGISHTYLDSLEKGYDARTNSKRSPSVVTVYKIAEYYKASFNELCGMITKDINERLEVNINVDVYSNCVRDTIVNINGR